MAGSKSPKVESGLKNKVETDLAGLAVKKTPDVEVQEGRALVLERVDDLEVLVRTHVPEAALTALAGDADTFVGVLKDLERRLEGRRATVDQLVGTFLEIIAPDHPIVYEVRNRLVETNLGETIQCVVLGEASFVLAGSEGAPKRLRELGAGDAMLPWSPGEAPRPAELAPSSKADPRRTEALVGTLRTRIDAHRVVPLRELTIDGSQFSDRAVFLELEGGYWLLLLSEEYKAPSSKDINAQVAIRDNRLFNDAVDSGSTLKARDTNGDEVVIPFDKLVVNLNTTRTDRVGVKAASRTRYERRVLTVTERIQERKAHYGEVTKLGTDANVSYVFVGLEYPAQALRTFLTQVWRQQQ
jgi:hypothetical protein